MTNRKNNELISVEELVEVMSKENVTIIDCRFDLMNKSYGEDRYLEGHIPGAVFLNIEKELAGEVKTHGGRHPLPSVKDIHRTLQNKGVSPNNKIVIYDDGDFSGAGRARLILKYLGFKNILLLDGGFDRYKEVVGLVSTHETDFVSKEFNVNINEDLFVDMEYVRRAIENDKIAIIDSREPDRYKGIIEPVDFKKGHIPTALNYFWMDVLDENIGKMKSIEELEKHFEALKKYEEIIVYCGSGITASVNSVALDIVGIKHKVYSGSFSDWITYEDNKIESLDF